MARRLSSPVFIGRAAELERVADLRGRVADTGQGETILVTGEAGIGKTRFLREIATRAQADGWLVLSGACDEFGAAARPFSALTEMTPALESFLVAEAPGELERPAWAALQALATGAAAPADTGSVVQVALVLFKRVSAVRPLLVVVDDLHWADESLRGLFGALVRGLAGSRAVVVGAYRENEIDRAHPLRPVLAAVHRNGAPEVIPVLPLGLEEAAELARAVGAGHEAAALAALHERAGGNTFLIEELLAAPPGQIPSGARDVVLSRLQGLPTDAGALAELAALDTSFDQAVLSHSAELGRAVFTAAFDALVGSQLVVQDGERFAYRHALIREVIAESIPPARKAAMHARLALALETVHPGQIGTIARHWLESGDKERALVAAVAAAEHAYGIGAAPESADWYEVAFALWGEALDPEKRLGMSLASLVLASDPSFAASRRFDRVIELMQGLLANPTALNNAERAELWLQLSFRAWQTNNEAVMLPLSFESLRESREAMEAEMDPSEQIRLLSLYAGHAIARYGLDEDAEAAFETLTRIAAENPGAGHPLMDGALSWLRLSRGGEELVEAIEIDPQAWLSRTLNREVNDASMLRAVGLNELAIDRGVASIRRALERGQIFSGVFELETHVAAALTGVGRWREALDRWEATKVVVGTDALREWATLVVQGWGALLVRSGNLEEAAFYRDAAILDLYPYLPFMGSDALVRVEFARIEGDAEQGRADLTRAIDASSGHHTSSLGEPVAYGIGLVADASFGSQGADANALAEIEHWFDRLNACVEYAPGRVNLWDLGMFLEQAEAERARLLGNDSIETWEDLAQRWHDLPRPYHEAYCRLRAASALLMAPAAAERKLSRERAAGHLEAALSITQELGAIYLEADLRELLKAAGLRTRVAGVAAVAPPAPAANGHPELTPRELEVLRLLVAGESNGQIAIRLGISTKTASVHVSNILRKLEVENRVEAAVRASRMGLTA